MTPEIKAFYDNLYITDKDLRYTAFQNLIAATNVQVDWAYEVWEDLVKLLSDKDNHLRTIGVQLLSNLSKSDPDNKILAAFPFMYEVTFDDKFVTARHSLQSLWKIAIVNKEYSDLVTGTLSKRFKEAIKEKNGTLLRYDILEVYKKIYDFNSDQAIRQLALELIVTEADPKYKKKYTTLWRSS